jgi:hypothetical protein
MTMHLLKISTAAMALPPTDPAWAGNFTLFTAEEP